MIVGTRLASDDDLVANLAYLAEQELCDSGLSFAADGEIAATPARITAKGIDFLAGDGGIRRDFACGHRPLRRGHVDGATRRAHRQCAARRRGEVAHQEASRDAPGSGPESSHS